MPSSQSVLKSGNSTLCDCPSDWGWCSPWWEESHVLVDSRTPGYCLLFLNSTVLFHGHANPQVTSSCLCQRSTSDKLFHSWPCEPHRFNQCHICEKEDVIVCSYKLVPHLFELNCYSFIVIILHSSLSASRICKTMRAFCKINLQWINFYSVLGFMEELFPFVMLRCSWG